MEITVKRINDALLFEAQNNTGATICIDGPTSLGGVNGGFRPMEMLLTSLATCSAFDIVEILKKQRQILNHISIAVVGSRQEQGQNKPFKTIHMTFQLTGTLDEQKVTRAVELSVEKYCSVKASLNPNIDITYDVKIN